MTILETERLLLRQLTAEDRPALCAILQDEEVMYAYAHAFSDREVDEWLQNQLTRYRRDYAFSVLGAEEVFSIIRDNNRPSRRVAERNGMTVRGSLVKHYYGLEMPHLVYGVRRSEA